MTSWCLWAVDADVLWAILSKCLVSNSVACWDGSVVYSLCSPCYEHWAEHSMAIIRYIFRSIASYLGWWPVFRMSMICWLHCCGRICKSLTRIGNTTLSVKLYLVDHHRGCLYTTSLFLKIPIMTYQHSSLIGLSSLFSQLTLAYLIGVAVLIFFFSIWGQCFFEHSHSRRVAHMNWSIGLHAHNICGCRINPFITTEFWGRGGLVRASDKLVVGTMVCWRRLNSLCSKLLPK